MTHTLGRFCLQTRQTFARSNGKIEWFENDGINNVSVVTRRKMQIHMEKARDHGYLDVDCPSVEYDYRDYVKQ